MPISTLFRAVAAWPLTSLLLVAGGDSSKPAGKGKPKTFHGVVAQPESRPGGARNGGGIRGRPKPTADPTLP
jgi:hypothetical protein